MDVTKAPPVEWHCHQRRARWRHKSRQQHAPNAVRARLATSQVRSSFWGFGFSPSFSPAACSRGICLLGIITFWVQNLVCEDSTRVPECLLTRAVLYASGPRRQRPVLFFQRDCALHASAPLASSTPPSLHALKILFGTSSSPRQDPFAVTGSLSLAS